jgi:ribonuclease P protein component
MRSGDEFRRTIRRGVKGPQPTLVAHVLLGAGDVQTDGPTSVGFVVSKAVGSAVDRNRVKRQLRHLMRDRLDRLPDGSRVVVRALPAAHGARADTLAGHLDSALARAGAR